MSGTGASMDFGSDGESWNQSPKDTEAGLYSHILKYWGLEFQHMNLGRGRWHSAHIYLLALKNYCEQMIKYVKALSKLESTVQT